MHQQAKFAVAPNYWGHRPGMHRVEPTLGRALAMYLPHDDRLGEALQMKLAQACALEQPLGEAVRACTYYDAVRPRPGLQARRNILRPPHHIDLLGLALPDRLPPQHLPAADADARAPHH